ncbi:MAG: aldose epimerase family protein [Rikenellaceae bacterium]
MSKISTYTLSAGDIEMVVTNYGGRVMKLFAPDRDGKMADVALGYETTDEYLNNKGERFLGAVCGRYGNRIALGEFTLDGVKYSLPINSKGQSLHGGLKGMDSVAWDVVEHTSSYILFRLFSADGEEGYPGNLTVDMSYELTPDNEFVIKYKATTDKATVLNLTHHSYFNLRGEGDGMVTDHLLQINSEFFIPVTEVSIPTGEVLKVEGTPFDFRELKPIGRDINQDDHQIKMGAGYDHCWVLNNGGEVALAATLIEPESGRRMDVYTDQVGIQFYSGNWFDGKTASKSGEGCYLSRGSLALETQLFPDAPNNPHFPTSRLDVGDEYTHTCIYKFSVEE